MIGIMNKLFLFIFVFIFCLPGLFAADLGLTQKEAGSYFRLESNRSLDYSGDVSVFSQIELNTQYGAAAGFAMGWLDEDFEIKAFASLRYTPFINIPLDLNLAYNYNGLPGASFNSHTHSLLPFISYNAKWAGISLGINMRFVSFFGEPAIFESMLSFSAYVNFVNIENLLVGITFANFSDFYI